MITIPWSVFGDTPVKGAEWEFNAIRENPKGQYIWEYNLDQKSYRNFKDQTGTLILE